MFGFAVAAGAKSSVEGAAESPGGEGTTGSAVKARNKLLELAFDGEHDEVAQLLTAAVDLPSVDVCDENGSTALSEARRTLTILVIVQSNTMIRE